MKNKRTNKVELTDQELAHAVASIEALIIISALMGVDLPGMAAEDLGRLISKLDPHNRCAGVRASICRGAFSKIRERHSCSKSD